jgi:rod shape-determining protein MreC
MLQFFLRRKRFFCILGLLFVSLTMLAKAVEKKRTYTFFDELLLTLFAFPLEATNRTVHFALSVWENYFYLVDLRQENIHLVELVEKLEMENQLLREQAVENIRLRRLLTFKETLAFEILPAEIIGRDPSSWFKTILINKGSRDGIRPGAGVITPHGVVGKIINAGFSSSKVLLITDVNSAVDAVVERSRSRGILEGAGENKAVFSYVLKSEHLLPGDVIITSGMNSIYPKGIALGTIRVVSPEKSGFFLVVDVLPAVDFSKLNEVLVVLQQDGDEPS